ncbi:hypothetical protein [Chitinimonas lacunae]|uniref:Uncharacterized protein n=1 Tax=Chitinimonas lacunae TaxID=1963018 RepID=A0ABV8MWA9_9NEIS
MASHSTAETVSLSHLLYLYLWPFWMFQDVNSGTQLERAAAYRHNREKRVYLPGYICKWSILFGLATQLIAASEALAEAGLLSPFLSVAFEGLIGVFASVAFVVLLQTGVVYVFLCRWRQ